MEHTVVTALDLPARLLGTALQVTHLALRAAPGWGAAPLSRISDRVACATPRTAIGLPGRLVRLHNGSLVELRPARVTDADHILDLYAALAPESRYYRFFTAGGTKSPADAARLVARSNRQHHAVVAVVRTDTLPIVAVAQLDGTEVALTVRDDYHKLGLGDALLTEVLAAARHRGLASVDAAVLPTNSGVLRLLRHHQAVLDSIADGVIHVTVPTASQHRLS